MWDEDSSEHLVCARTVLAKDTAVSKVDKKTCLFGACGSVMETDNNQDKWRGAPGRKTQQIRDGKGLTISAGEA